MTVSEDMINPAGAIKRLLVEEWSDHNTLAEGTEDERDMPMSEDSVIKLDEPQPGQSSRSLPSTIRAQPVIFVWDTDAVDMEQGDVHYLTEDFSSTVRAQVVVANGLHGRHGSSTRDDYVRVITEIRRSNRVPTGGIAGSRWSKIEPGTIDRTPTEYGEQWRANVDFQLSADNVLI